MQTDRLPATDANFGRILISALPAGGPDDGDADGRPAGIDTHARSPQQATRRLRCVVVEDEAIIAIELVDMLDDLGVDVVGVAINAAEAVRLAETERPDFFTMDIRLQGDRDGISAATEIFQRFGIRSIFVSAFVGDTSRRPQATDADPIGWLAKPVRRDALEKLLPRPRRNDA